MWWTKGWTVRGVALVAAMGGALQLAPGPARVNPPVTPSHTLQGATQVPRHVDAMLRRACLDCHSNETRWPWYSYVAPMSWVVVNDITRARKAMNLSEWGPRTEKRPAAAVGQLTAICAGVKQDRMPLPQYVLIHPESRLTPADKQALCEWTAAEITRTMERRRKTLVTHNAR
ncbi:MAG TPA: heme-binding domain-containing protein [Bryobacteraceae bacterium]|nr:heme-binding domain-containing protein [Bryobacteraceae bacterium]